MRGADGVFGRHNGAIRPEDHACDQQQIGSLHDIDKLRRGPFLDEVECLAGLEERQNDLPCAQAVSCRKGRQG